MCDEEIDLIYEEALKAAPWSKTFGVSKKQQILNTISLLDQEYKKWRDCYDKVAHMYNDLKGTKNDTNDER